MTDTTAKLPQEEKKDEPWYVKADYEWFEHQYKNEYFKAMDLGNVIRRFLKEAEGAGKDLTTFTEQFAQENIGKSGRTLRRLPAGGSLGGEAEQGRRMQLRPPDGAGTV